jgi:hypothetical protein
MYKVFNFLEGVLKAKSKLAGKRTLGSAGGDCLVY